jgi:hypothetical protein
MSLDVVHKMEEPTIQDRQRWWLLYYGITSMEKAIKSCDLIAQHCTTNADPLFQPLSLAVHAFYARPFKGNGKAGSLPRDLVPDDAKGIHSWLEHFRDGVMAHVDPKKTVTAGHPMNDVVYTICGSKRQFSTLEARPSVEVYTDARAHCEVMIDVFQNSITGFLESFHRLLPQHDGLHLLSIADGTPLFIDGYVMPVRSHLNYK